MKNKETETILCIIAVAMILVCMSSLPSWLIFIVKALSAGVLAYLSYISFKQKNTKRGLFLFILTLLLQPFFALPVGKVVWTCLEIGIVFYLIYILLNARNETGKKSRKRKKK